MRSILITGHKGYIGSHFFHDFIPHLVFPAGERDEFNLVTVDLKEDSDFVNINGGEFDTVIHFAASVSVTESFEKPDEYHYNNVTKVRDFLQNNKVRKFIFTSSGGSMYGNKLDAKEEDASYHTCYSPYARSKFIAESIITGMCKNYCILRLSNVYGGKFELRTEKSCHHHFYQDNPIVVYGGEQSRDFIHVFSVVNVIRRAIYFDVIGTYNIGSGDAIKIIDVAKTYSDSRKVPIEIKPKRTGEVDFISLDVSKAAKAKLLI